MQTVLFANGPLGVRVARYLHDREQLTALVLHPDGRRSWPADADDLPEPLVWPIRADELAPLEPTCLLSVMFGYVLPPELLAVPSWRAVNLHPGYLPWNRGADPNVWPLVDGSPAGTTLHVMEPEVDAGAIIVQARVDVVAVDTAETLHARLLDRSYELFVNTWPNVRSIEPTTQPDGGSYHRRADLASLDLDESDLPTLAKLRARTFREYGAGLEMDEQRYWVRVQIDPAS